jgi:acid phosphatase type 7
MIQREDHQPMVPAGMRWWQLREKYATLTPGLILVWAALKELRRNMRLRTTHAGMVLIAASVLLLGLAAGVRQAGQSQSAASAIPVAGEPGPTFVVNDQDLHMPVTVIAYGDMRFTDPANVTATNPVARRALVERVMEEKPDAILLNGDVPWHGGDKKDYEVYRSETQAWRDANLRVFPALGNHEFAECLAAQCLANWWATFPKLKGRRWYSVSLGPKIYAIALDSDDSLLPGNPQARWLQAEIESLPRSVEFVFIAMHHPPVADIQTQLNVDHNPRPNEIALARLLKTAAAEGQAKFVVIAGHIHNYERFLQDDVVYLVSGGGGAAPYPVERTPPDLYQDSGFPNYHYVKFVLEGRNLHGTMYRLAEPNTGTWEAKDNFEVHAK